MKKTLLLASAALALSAFNAAAALPESEVPSGVSVLPTPNSTIDVSANQYPLGASSIGINFGVEVAPNPNNTTPALLYYNDFTSPVSTSLRASVDEMTKRTAGVLFSDKWTKNGEYKIVVPEGMFLTDSGSATPGLILYYEINVPWYATPVNDMTVTELQDIVLTFPNATSVEFNSSNQFEFGTLDQNFGFVKMIEDNKVIIKMDQGGIASVLTTPGNYLLHIGEGSIKYVENGVTKFTNEIRLTYHIPSSPEPSMWPYCDEPVTNGLEYFEVTLPFGFKLPSDGGFLLANDRAACNLYPADEYGNVDMTAPVCVAKILQSESNLDRGVLYLALFDPSTLEPLNCELDKHDSFWQSDWTVVPGSLKPWKPAVSGSYCLILPQGLYSGNYQSIVAGSSEQFVTSDPFRFYYDIVGETTAVENVAVEAEAVNAYTLTGICVLKNASLDDVKNLPAGFYVVNGKKVIVK